MPLQKIAKRKRLKRLDVIVALAESAGAETHVVRQAEGVGSRENEFSAGRRQLLGPFEHSAGIAEMFNDVAGENDLESGVSDCAVECLELLGIAQPNIVTTTFVQLRNDFSVDVDPDYQTCDVAQARVQR
jgi:hypothetical protein